MTVPTIAGASTPPLRPAVAAAAQPASRAADAPAAAGQASSSASEAAAQSQANAKSQQQAAAELQDVLESARKAIRQTASSNLEFSVDEQLGRTIVRLVDTQTQEVIRQIPSEDFLRIARSIDSMKGLLVREKG